MLIEPLVEGRKGEGGGVVDACMLKSAHISFDCV
jgi:hypothetical protein